MKTFKSFFKEKVLFPKGQNYYVKAAEYFLEKNGVNPKSVEVLIDFKNSFDEKDGLTIQSETKPNRFMVYIGKNHDQADVLRVIAHEMVHVSQIVKGDLKLDHKAVKVYWKGQEVDLKKMRYNQRPFEIEAYKKEKLYLLDFVKKHGHL